MICSYCNNEAKLVSGNVIYPHRPDLAYLRFWQCAPCAAYVGCHKGTTKPLGRIANAELRQEIKPLITKYYKDYANRSLLSLDAPVSRVEKLTLGELIEG